MNFVCFHSRIGQPSLHSLLVHCSVHTMNLSSLFYILLHFFGAERQVKSLAILHCFNEEITVKIFDLLSNHGFSIILLPINELNASQVTTIIREHSFGLNSMGIFLNYECSSSGKILASVSKVKLLFVKTIYL